MISIIKLGAKQLIVNFLGEVEPDVITTQRAFLEASFKNGLYKDNETVIVDNRELNLEVGVVVFFDLATGKCGFSHTLPGVIVRLFMEISSKQRPKLWWYTVYKGGALPNPTYPFPCKKPWSS